MALPKAAGRETRCVETWDLMADMAEYGALAVFGAYRGGEAQAFAGGVGIPVLAEIPADEDIRRKSANYEIIGKPGGRWAPLFEGLAQRAAEAPPVRPKPLSHDELLGLFKGEAVGRGVTLMPATLADMCGAAYEPRPSLEVVYEGA